MPFGNDQSSYAGRWTSRISSTPSRHGGGRRGRPRREPFALTSRRGARAPRAPPRRRASVRGAVRARPSAPARPAPRCADLAALCVVARPPSRRASARRRPRRSGRRARPGARRPRARTRAPACRRSVRPPRPRSGRASCGSGSRGAARRSGSSPSAFTRFASACHGRRTSSGRRRRPARLRMSRSTGAFAASTRRSRSCDVALAAERLEESRVRCVAIRLRASRARAAAPACSASRELRRPAAGGARAARRRRARRRGSRASHPSSSRSADAKSSVEERPKRPQVGAQPSCRDARLVHAFRIDVEPDDGVVQDQPDDGERDRAAHDVAGRRVGRRGRRPAISGVSGASARERADVLRRLVGRPGARLPQALDERVEERRASSRRRSRPRARGSRAAGSPSSSTDTASSTTPPMSRPSASWSSVRRRIVVMRTLLVELLVPDEPAHELDRRGRRAAAVSLEDDLRTHEERRVALRGQLHGPALAGPMPQARAPAGESQVVRVVVRRVVALGRRLPHDRPDQAVDARHAEVGRRGQLQLAFGAVLHSRLRVASSGFPARGAPHRRAAKPAASSTERPRTPP